VKSLGAWGCQKAEVISISALQGKRIKGRSIILWILMKILAVPGYSLFMAMIVFGVCNTVYTGLKIQYS
jgi:hypothetical protein